MKGKQAARAAARRRAAATTQAAADAARAAELAQRMAVAKGREATAAARLLALAPMLDDLAAAEAERHSTELNARKAERAAGDARRALQAACDAMLITLRTSRSDRAAFDRHGFAALIEAKDLGFVEFHGDDSGKALAKFRERAGITNEPLRTATENRFSNDWDGPR